MKKTRGFTLIELLYTLVVAALVLTLGMPAFQSTTRNSRLSSSVNDMVAALQLARSEAIKRRLPVTVCATSDSASENAGCEGDASWEDGLIVFVDDNGDGARDANELLLRQQRSLRAGVTVATPDNQPLQESMTYLANGFPNLGGLDAAGMLVFCDDRQSDVFARVIAIAQTGRPLATRLADRPDLGVSCE